MYLSPWTKVFLGQLSPWTNVSLDNSVVGLMSLGQTVTWTTVPWTNVSTPLTRLEQVVNVYMIR